VKAVRMGLRPRARRLLSRTHVLRARATLSMRDAGALRISRATVTLRLLAPRRER
jgi:hypothetical protein